MLLLNGEQFIPTGTGPNQKIQREHYKEAIAFLRKEYSQGGRNNVITLVRRKEQKRNASGALEETAPMIFPAKAYPEIQFSRKDEKVSKDIGGMETWAYSGRRPQRKNAGDDFQPDPKSIKFMNHFEGFNMDTHMDLIYFLLYKSPNVYFPTAIGQGKVKKGELMVDDKAQRARDKVRQERAVLKLKNAIMAPDITSPLYNDANLRKVAAAWGLDGAMDEYTSVDDLRLRLEHSVKGLEKVKEVTQSGKGLTEFFELLDFDDAVRQRAMMAFAIDKEIIKYDVKENRYVYSSSQDVLVDVPAKNKHSSFDYLAEFLGNELNEREWNLFKREVINKDYLEMLAFDDLKWLCKQQDIALSQKSGDVLREDLAKVYCASA